MKFLIDEDVPAKLLRSLNAAGHDAVRVTPSTADREIAKLAIAEDRIIITLDKDFTNRLLYPPSSCNIIHVRIHPPFADTVAGAVMQLLEHSQGQRLRGLIILERDGITRITE